MHVEHLQDYQSKTILIKNLYFFQQLIFVIIIVYSPPIGGISVPKVSHENCSVGKQLQISNKIIFNPKIK